MRYPVESVTFVSLFYKLWSLKKGVLLGAVVGLILAGIISVNVLPKYEAQMIVGPTQPQENALGGLLNGQSQNNIFNELVRQAIPTRVADFHAFEYTLTASHLATKLLKDKDLTKQIFFNNWDTVQKSWAKDFLKEGHKKPTPEQLKERLNKDIRVHPVGLTPFKRVTYKHPDPIFASLFLRRLYNEADSLLKKDIQHKTEERVRYLTEQIKNVRNPEHRDVLTSLLKEQERARLMTAMDLPFAAQFIEPPYSSHKPVSPNIWLILSTCLMLGALLGGFSQLVITQKPYA